MSFINPSNISFGDAGNLIVGLSQGKTDSLSIGTQNQVLTADSTQTLGVKWADIPLVVDTWTPTVMGSGTPGTATYSVQEGFYAKIGVLVFVSAYLVFSEFTGTGVLSVSLPFEVDSGMGTTANGPCLFDATFTTGTCIEATSIAAESFTLFTVFGSGATAASQSCVDSATLAFSLMYQYSMA